MKSIKGTLTEQNLLKAFAGESQARNRYYLFSQTAKLEGYEEIAGVFFETAEQEREHAKRFFDFMEGGMVSITAEYPAGKEEQLQKIFWKRLRVNCWNGRLCIRTLRVLHWMKALKIFLSHLK